MFTGADGMHVLEWAVVIVTTILAFKEGYREGGRPKKAKPHADRLER